MTVPLEGRAISRAQPNSADLEDVQPFRLLADGLEGAKANMGAYTLAAVGATFDGKPGSSCSRTSFSLEGGGHAEGLQDHDCAIGRSTS